MPQRNAVSLGVEQERARLRPLLERCLTEANVANSKSACPRTGQLIADLRRELGKEG